MSDLPSGVVPTNSLIGNGRKKLLVIGKTGTGKSTLCNAICGHGPDANVFPVSAEAQSCTQRTFFCEVFFNKDNERPVSLIDTIGFDDPDKDDDAKIIAELVDKLKNACDYVNLFVIAVNGQNPRLDGSLLGMIRIFEGMFGQDFWKQVVVLFTRIPMDTKSKKKRVKNTGQTDDKLAEKYMEEVAKRFKKGKGIGYLFLDACYDDDDEDEKSCFEKGLEDLWERIDDADGLPTTKVREVETKTAALQRQIEEKEKERRDAENALKQQLEEWDRQRQESERRAEELQADLDRKLQEVEERQRKKEEQMKKEMEEERAKLEASQKKMEDERKEAIARGEKEKERQIQKEMAEQEKMARRERERLEEKINQAQMEAREKTHRLEAERNEAEAKHREKQQEMTSQYERMKTDYEKKGYSFGDASKSMFKGIKKGLHAVTFGVFKKKK